MFIYDKTCVSLLFNKGNLNKKKYNYSIKQILITQHKICCTTTIFIYVELLQVLSLSTLYKVNFHKFVFQHNYTIHSSTIP